MENKSSTYDSESKIDVEEIKPDMILTRDVVAPGGRILLAKDIMLNNVNFTKLMSYGVEHVFVRSKAIIEKEKIAPIKKTFHQYDSERKKIPVVERESFKKFVTVYNEKKEEVKRCLLAISDGDAIDLEELYKLTDGIMSKLTCKSDVLNFVGFIKGISEHTYTHSNNVALLCNLFAHWLRFDETETMYLTTAGLLHDIGKTKTPLEILNKKGRLTPEEFEIMKKHTTDGYNILLSQNIPEEIKLAALMHHEKIDGSGYPMAHKDKYIDKYAKIVSICDIYDAMTANRIYREKICPFKVIRNFETNCFGELDTEYLLVFLKNIAYTYLGSWIILSDKREAEVIFINPNHLSKPIVRISQDEIIDLNTRDDLSIIHLI